MVVSIVKLTHILGTESEWISLQSYLRTLVAKVFPAVMSWISMLFLTIELRSLVATVTSLSKNLKSGLFMRDSVLSNLLTYFGKISRYLETF